MMLEGYEFITIVFTIFWGLFCFFIGRISRINKELNKQWGDQKAFHEWKQNQKTTKK